MADFTVEHHHHIALGDDTRSFFLALIAPVITGLAHLETLVATEAEALAALDAKVTDLIADVRAALDALAADRNSIGPDGQAALDVLTAKVDAFDAEVGDADGSDTPPVP